MASDIMFIGATIDLGIIGASAVPALLRLSPLNHSDPPLTVAVEEPTRQSNAVASCAGATFPALRRNA